MVNPLALAALTASLSLPIAGAHTLLDTAAGLPDILLKDKGDNEELDELARELTAAYEEMADEMDGLVEAGAISREEADEALEAYAEELKEEYEAAAEGEEEDWLDEIALLHDFAEDPEFMAVIASAALMDSYESPEDAIAAMAAIRGEIADDHVGRAVDFMMVEYHWEVSEEAALTQLNAIVSAAPADPAEEEDEQGDKEDWNEVLLWMMKEDWEDKDDWQEEIPEWLHEIVFLYDFTEDPGFSALVAAFWAEEILEGEAYAAWLLEHADNSASDTLARALRTRAAEALGDAGQTDAMREQLRSLITGG